MNDVNKLKKLRQHPTVIDNKHESLYRAYQLLQYVRVLLELGTPHEVILMIIDATYKNNLDELHETTWEEMQAGGKSK